jgi:hypothetical protein
MNIEYSGTVNGDTMKGVMGMGQFSNEWTAARIREEKKKE